MRNIFRPSLFLHLTLRERILHSIATAGVALAVVDYLTMDYYEEGPLMGIVFALFGGIVSGLVLGIAEHLFLGFYRKRRNTKENPKISSASTEPKKTSRGDATSLD